MTLRWPTAGWGQDYENDVSVMRVGACASLYRGAGMSGQLWHLIRGTLDTSLECLRNVTIWGQILGDDIATLDRVSLP